MTVENVDATGNKAETKSPTIQNTELWSLNYTQHLSDNHISFTCRML